MRSSAATGCRKSRLTIYTRDALLCWGRSDCLASTAAALRSRVRALEHLRRAGNSGGVQSGVLAARLNQRVSESRCRRGSECHDGTRIRGIQRKRSPNGNGSSEPSVGLRQSRSHWWSTIDKHLVEINFKRLMSDPCVYIY